MHVTRRSILMLAVIGILFVPAIAAAAPDWIPLVPCGGADQPACNPCHIFETIKKIFDLILKGITGPIAAFMIVWAGGMMLLGGGNPELYSKGKAMLRQTLIGVTVILLSWVATNFLIKSLIRGNQGDGWNEFSCPAELTTIKPIETALPSKGPLPPLPEATILTPEHVGAAVLGGIPSEPSGGGSEQGCYSGLTCPAEAECPKLRPLLENFENKKLLEAIMFHESSCLIKPRPSGAGAYGLMQIQPATANANRVGCNVVDADGNPIEINAAWLTSEQNLDEIVCVANNIVNALKRQCGDNPLNIAAGYNGSRACEPSRDCASMQSCVDGGAMRRWECPWNNPEHTEVNKGYRETRNYAPKVAVCAQ